MLLTRGPHEPNRSLAPCYRRRADLPLAFAAARFEVFQGLLDLSGGCFDLVGEPVDSRFGGNALAWWARFAGVRRVSACWGRLPGEAVELGGGGAAQEGGADVGAGAVQTALPGVADFEHALASSGIAQQREEHG